MQTSSILMVRESNHCYGVFLVSCKWLMIIFDARESRNPILCDVFVCSNEVIEINRLGNDE